VLAVEGLRSAIQNYEERHGIVKEKKPTTEEVVRQRLRRVINPLTGLNVVRTNLVKDIKVKDGNVTVTVDLPRDHQFANNVKDEVRERIETLWDVKGVVVEFTE
jgi:metal-sulfur cluster biosynthetic enzyme